jgi:hypothetical protein
MNKFLTIAALVLATGTAFAAGEAKAPKLVTCEQFEIFKAESGAPIGMCQPTKPGGKPRYLRSYVVVKVVNPATEQPVSAMVGFQ